MQKFSGCSTMNVEVEDKTILGRCSNCGECCTNFIPMTKDEIKQIHSYLGKHPEVTEQRHEGAEFDLTCPFRDENKKRCLIYEVRPAICRSFICNKDTDVLKQEKLQAHKRGREVMMRNEFFGSDEELRMIQKLLNS